MPRFADQTPAEMTDEERETIESLVNYPSLERAFAEENGAENTREKMRRRVVELERVLRSGTQAEADRAALILKAYRTTLDFLAELEERRRQNSK